MTIPAGPMDPGPLVQKAEESKAAGNYVDAAKWYERAYVRSRSGGKDTAESNRYLILVGDMALAAGDARQALGAWRKVMLNDPNNEAAEQKIVDFLLDAVALRRAAFSTSSFSISPRTRRARPCA